MAVVDLKMPGRSGLDLVRELRALDAGTRIVVLTGYGSIATAVEAIKLGARHYLTKPADADEILTALGAQADEDLAARRPRGGRHPLAGPRRMGAHPPGAGRLRAATSPRPPAGWASTAARCSASWPATHPGREGAGGRDAESDVDAPAVRSRLETRRARHEKLGLRGVRVVEALAVGSVTGIVAATLVFLVANRLLPAARPLPGLPRPQLEMLAFYLTWLATFAHAAWRPRVAWRQQCRAIGGLAIAAVALNWLTTGDHLIRTLARGATAVAGVDALLLAAAAVALAAAHQLGKRTAAATPAVAQGPSTVELSPPERKAAHG